MRNYRYIGLFIWVFAMGGCKSPVSKTQKEVPPDEVIRRHFELLDQKNVDGAESCLVESRRNQIDWDFRSQESRKLLDLKENKDSNYARSYMTTGRGSVNKPFDLKVFTVKFDLKTKDSAIEHGVLTWNYYVIKETKDSPWLIDDWGI